MELFLKSSLSLSYLIPHIQHHKISQKQTDDIAEYGAEEAFIITYCESP